MGRTEPAEVRETPAVGDVADRGELGVGPGEVLVGSVQPHGSQVGHRRCSSETAESGLQALGADRNGGGELPRRPWVFRAAVEQLQRMSGRPLAGGRGLGRELGRVVVLIPEQQPVDEDLFQSAHGQSVSQELGIGLRGRVDELERLHPGAPGRAPQVHALGEYQWLGEAPAEKAGQLVFDIDRVEHQAHLLGVVGPADLGRSARSERHGSPRHREDLVTAAGFGPRLFRSAQD